MDIYTREIERKYTLQGVSYDLAFKVLKDFCQVLASSNSYDQYWKAPHVDFIRLRENSKELTVKVTDKTTIVDRIEENVVLDANSMESARKALTLVFGPPCLKLTKDFSVFKYKMAPVIGTAYEPILCLYKIEGDPEDRLFFEIEAESLKIVDFAYYSLQRIFRLTPETRSLFQIFMGDK